LLLSGLVFFYYGRGVIVKKKFWIGLGSGVVLLATFSFFLTSCSSNSSIEKSVAKTESSKKASAQEFLDYLAYQIDKQTIAHPKVPSNWDETELYYFTDLLVLHRGYQPESWQHFKDRLKHQVYEGMGILFSEKDNKAFQRGLKYYEKQAEKRYDDSARKWLTRFYFETYTKFKDISRSLFWAHKDAECGGGAGMLHLAYAYAAGKGVIQDPEESIKWLLLAQIANDFDSRYAKEIFKEIENSYSPNPEILAEIKPKSLEKAKSWMQEHPNAFFDPSTNNSLN